MVDSFFSNKEILHFLVFLNSQIDEGSNTAFTINDEDFYNWSNDLEDCDNYLIYLSERKVLEFDNRMVSENVANGYEAEEVDTNDEGGLYFYKIVPFLTGKIFIDEFKSYFESKLEEMHTEMANLKKKTQEIINYNPEVMKNNIIAAKEELERVKLASKDSVIFKGLQDLVKDFPMYLDSIEVINDNFTEVYTNVILPIKDGSNRSLESINKGNEDSLKSIRAESEKGLIATKKTAVCGIVITVVVSIVLQIIALYISFVF